MNTMSCGDSQSISAWVCVHRISALHKCECKCNVNYFLAITECQVLVFMTVGVCGEPWVDSLNALENEALI